MIDVVDQTNSQEHNAEKPRLSEILFGELGKREFNIDDSGQDCDLGGWLSSRQNEIITKYRLPDRNLRFTDTREYLKQLYSILQANGTKIIEKEVDENNRGIDDCVFDEDTNEIAVPRITEDANQDEWIKYASNLAHETVHAIQETLTPEMPIEEMELEAYLGVNTKPDLLSERWLQGTLVYEVGVSSSYYRNNKGLEIPWR